MKTKYANMPDDELQVLINEKQTYIEKLFYDKTLSWKEYCDAVDGTNIWEMYIEKNNRQIPLLIDADEFQLECQIPIKSFKKSCKQGCFTDYDGSGYYGTITEISDIPVSCKAFDNDMERKDFDYVYWFNK